MNYLSEKIIKFKSVVLFIVLFISILLGLQIKNLHINSDIISSFPDDDPIAKLYKDIGSEFSGNDMGIIVLESANVFTKDVIEQIRMITDTLMYSEGISNVTSLTNIIDIKSSDWGIEIANLIDVYDLPTLQTDIDTLRDYVMTKNMYKGTIVSDDGKAAAIIFTLLPLSDKQIIAKDIREKIENMNLSNKIHFGGLPMMLNDVNDMIIADIIWLIPIVFIIIISVLLLSFRTFKNAILPLITALIAVLWTLGIMAYLNYELTIISNIIPVVLLAVGSAYTIHVLNSVNQFGYTDNKKSITHAMGYIFIPIILSAITTAIGFISFVFGSYLLMIKDFGIFVAIGTLISLLLSLFLIPALLAFFPNSNVINDKEKNNNNKSFLTFRLLMPLLNYLFKYPKYILMIWGIVIIICLGGLFYIETSVNMVDYFKKNNATRKTEDLMQEKFGGSLPVFVVFEGDLHEPEVLKLMAQTQLFMQEDERISHTQSVADLIKQMNDAMGEGSSIPDEKAKIEQLWFLIEGQEIMQQMVNDDLTKGIIQSRFGSIKSKDMEEFTDKMNAFISQHENEFCAIKLTGMPSVYIKLNNSLIKSQYTSLIIAIILVFVIVSFILKSLSKGFFAAVPVVATVILLFGFMGIAGISLDIATVLVASIALGIGVDYAIHIITGFNTYLEQGNNIKKALEKVILSSGNAVVINVLSVSAGFLVLLFSQFVPLQNFGLLVGVCMFGSGLGALTLLPVLLLLTYKNK